MNFIDIILILVVLLGMWGGSQKGFILSVIDLLTLALSVVSAYLFYPYLTRFIDNTYSLGVWTMPVSFILILLLSRILLGVIFNQLLRTLPASTHSHDVNRVLGVIPGFVSGAINAIILAALLFALPISDAIAARMQESSIAGRLAIPAEWAEEKLSPVFDKAVNRSMNKLTVEPESSKSITLPFKVTRYRVREDLEARMLDMVNEERAKEGLPALKADPEMAVVARKHSADMFARGYFAHVNLDGQDPFDRMREEKVRFLTAGENLALAQTLTIAHNGLMNSPGHRANILRPAFGRVGIGILDGGIYGLMITQNFRN
jgi:uncharacterized protein YkwD